MSDEVKGMELERILDIEYKLKNRTGDISPETVSELYEDIEWLIQTVNRQRKTFEKIALQRNWSDCIRLAFEELKK